ncbi:hypothetical protein RND81_10G123500 [Saponaria officinalis]|uniref:Retrovirus-related Pol polyprotein from transposon TNT 1-94-like beta-barrel domain-containing protein n=1 Tax=Saponaria officinalis TaxID=3572 RepID=A0AAW1I1I2_SAPOF
MNTLPTISKVTTEMAEYLAAVEAQAEERRLFQFLNGLDKQYGILRNNILMKDPLPTVDDTVSLILQEEIQSTNLAGTRMVENSALMGKGEYVRQKYTHCGRDNYRSDLCWEVRGYPVGHPKHKKANFKPDAHAKTEESELSTAIGAATLQLENLLKCVPNNSTRNNTGEESEEELECNFAGMTNTYQIKSDEVWIVDTGATNHMTAHLNMLDDVEPVANRHKINLPDENYVRVTHRGNATLSNGLELRNVFYIPEFKQNLLSVHQLTKDNKCYMTFFDDKCYVQEYSNGRVRSLTQIRILSQV